AEVLKQKGGGELSVVDFGSGKSYLTFAVHYFLTEILKVPCRIFGLDLKKDVIDYCSALCGELGLKNLSFAVGDIAEFSEDRSPDIVITLHACDTATDFALNYAVKKGAAGILSVPCCQHEINSQLKKHSSAGEGVFEPLLKYGLIKERFSALVTDALRGELLEQAGYRVQMLEFIDDEGTPKNLMIRAVKKGAASEKAASAVEGGGTGKATSAVEGDFFDKETSSVEGAASEKAASAVEGGGAKKSSCRILQELGVRQTLEELLTGSISE
uniref:class I SAM-dependent methyltransferase n=1 Tax=uncultured Treponema sp. TaxID=162155 RepID=UPI0015BCEA1E